MDEDPVARGGESAQTQLGPQPMAEAYLRTFVGDRVEVASAATIAPTSRLGRRRDHGGGRINSQRTLEATSTSKLRHVRRASRWVATSRDILESMPTENFLSERYVAERVRYLNSPPGMLGLREIRV